MFNLKDGFGDDDVVDILKSQLNHEMYDWGWRNFYSPLNPHHPAPTVPRFLSLTKNPTSLPFSWEAVPQSSFQAESSSSLYAPFSGRTEAGGGKLGSWGQGCLSACDQIFCLATGGIPHRLLDFEGGTPGGEAVSQEVGALLG